MEFRFTAEQEQFRHDVRSFLETELSTPDGAEARREGHSQAFSKKLSERGWIGVAWPEEYGGGGLGIIEQLIFREELVGGGGRRSAIT